MQPTLRETLDSIIEAAQLLRQERADHLDATADAFLQAVADELWDAVEETERKAAVEAWRYRDAATATGMYDLDDGGC